MSLLQFFNPSLPQVFGLISVLITIFCFGCYGALVGGRNRFAAADIFTGWGLVIGTFTVIGVLAVEPFYGLVFVFWALSAVSAVVVWSRDRFEGLELGAYSLIWRILALGIPLLILVSAMKASQWDEFSQWLPNAVFLFRFDGFPSSSFPQSLSVYPAYPPSSTLTIYIVSRLSGFFVENAGGLANLVMLFCFAPVYLSVVVRGIEFEVGWNRKWGYAAFGLLGVTVLSTVFVQKLIFTAYADTPTAIVLGVLGVLVWMILDDLANEKPAPATLAWQFSLVAALFINFKQPNPVLLVILLASALLVAVRDPKIKVKNFFKLWPVMLTAPVIVWLSWRYHVGQHLVGREFNFQPYENWLFSQTFEILSQMFMVAKKKGFYFVMMGALSVYAIWSVFRYRGGFDRMAILAGGMFLGYNLFLLVMYITAFGAYNAMRATSFWRFNTQLGILGCTAAAFGLAILWRKYGIGKKITMLSKGRAFLPGLAIALVVAIPFVTAEALRFDVRPPKDHMRMVGRYLAKTLPANSNVAVVDPGGQGLASHFIRYEMMIASGNPKNYRITYKYRVTLRSPEDIAKDVREQKITHMWVHIPLPRVNAPLGLKLAKHHSHLLEWAGTDWRLIKSWPYDGYEDPMSFPD